MTFKFELGEKVIFNGKTAVIDYRTYSDSLEGEAYKTYGIMLEDNFLYTNEEELSKLSKYTVSIKDNVNNTTEEINVEHLSDILSKAYEEFLD